MAGHLFLLGFLVLFSGYIFYLLYSLALNYYRIKKAGLPIVILPINCGSPLWMSIDTTLLPLFEHLPFGVKNFTRFNWRGWELKDRYKAHQELGDIFVFVTPGKNWLQLCNAEAVTDVLTRKGRIHNARDQAIEYLIGLFGDNVATTEGRQWQRHRKITASCFNEQPNALVWSESIRQATGMLQYWLSKSSIDSVANDARTLSLHVIASAAFGQSYTFRGADDVSTNDDRDSSSYKDSLKLVLDNCLPLAVIGLDNLDKWWLPNSWKELRQATITFKSHMRNLYEQEKQAMAQGKNRGNNLMSSLVRASQVDIQDTGDIGQAGLTEQEIYGNMFEFNFAGHDTTANALCLGLVYLAARPDVQDWIHEEINAVLGDKKVEDSSYTESFPRLKRCLAVMYETVRLYSPSAILRTTGPKGRTLKVGDHTYVLPAHTMIVPSYSALHTHPRYWGDNSLEWEPSRWIISNSPDVPSTILQTLDSEIFMEHPKDANPFIAWSVGGRVCPGKKLAQVEWVAVMASLFQKYKVTPVLQDGEDEKAARQRLQLLIKKHTGFKLMLKLLRPEEAVLAWVQRF
ncbi:cytochrome P450 protein [Rutstroemia sp. NJR-2017a WRK4]|nr:cytochrome P450 protein [Rutstroemia sp. NJR-2017a WRK4]